MATTNNVVGVIAKAIKKKHADISGSIDTLSAAYENAATEFQTEEITDEGAFQTAYTALDADKETSESVDLAESMTRIQDQRDLIVSNSTDAVDSLLEFEAQISSSYEGFVSEREAHSSSLASIREDIRADWGVDTVYSTPSVAAYTPVSASGA
jgi:hypothetical protein|tara:strand:- start:308 stop:769 length:462 start_codon:yes stop_codon:yes gene_type:complete